jgi:hypothetical protein
LVDIVPNVEKQTSK